MSSTPVRVTCGRAVVPVPALSGNSQGEPTIQSAGYALRFASLADVSQLIGRCRHQLSGHNDVGHALHVVAAGV